MHFPIQADTLEAVIESIRELYPLLFPEFVRHVAKYGYRQSQDGKYVPRYDTRMSTQCQRMGYSTENLISFLSRIPCPTLIVRGEKSPFLTKEDAKRILGYLPRGILKEISHSAHMPAQENLEEFNAVVWNFLSSQD